MVGDGGRTAPPVGANSAAGLSACPRWKSSTAPMIPTNSVPENYWFGVDGG